VAKAASRVSPLQCPLDFHLPSPFLYLKSKIMLPTVQRIVEAPLAGAGRS
jgi:hypothetical protein